MHFNISVRWYTRKLYVDVIEKDYNLEILCCVQEGSCFYYYYENDDDDDDDDAFMPNSLYRINFESFFYCIVLNDTGMDKYYKHRIEVVHANKYSDKCIKAVDATQGTKCIIF